MSRSLTHHSKFEKCYQLADGQNYRNGNLQSSNQLTKIEGKGNGMSRNFAVRKRSR